MKWSGSAPKGGQHARCLIVDGYNVIGRMKRTAFRDIDDMEALREALVDQLAEYRAYTGETVIVVFDAYRTEEAAVTEERQGVQVVYTYRNETADERIERLAYELRDVYGQVTVATSDALEQQVAFGSGALRISADELLRRLRAVKTEVRRRVAEADGRRLGQVEDRIEPDVAELLERWRRNEGGDHES
ncbi:hypothetical protein GCM10010885_08040 [Alicyclobacillus cellulosilyticus]|uniref:NYN domain-containing protein n=1 Tax=Alicyclobacillus cellulosilyticus TaxID=1003997 RepID=A0A917K7R7_9BACL|nr:NYN domain-containing protein [Alicyclobacillus cellulosilyticus]GGJ01252.1 hypothetical protein GCM10010885_08040 [Alicyclobacillus cellulosilyticus]